MWPFKARNPLEKVVKTFSYATDKAGKTGEPIANLWLAWTAVAMSCGKHPKPGTSPYLAMATLCEAIIHLICSEKTRILYELQPTVTFQGRPPKPCWQASASKAVELANKAGADLPALSSIANEVIARANVQASVSIPDATSDVRFRHIKQPSGQYVMIAYEFALASSGLSVADVVQDTLWKNILELQATIGIDTGSMVSATR